MAIIPLNIPLNTTWLDITDDIFNNFETARGVEFYLPYEHTKTLEILVDTSGVAVIDESFDNTGTKLDRYFLSTSTRLNSDYKYYARALETISTLSIKDLGNAVSVEGVDDREGALRVIAGYGDITQDAWGHQKVVKDVSLFGSAFTFNIDRNLWVPYEQGVEIYYDVILTRFSTLNGKLKQVSGPTIGNYSYLMSRRHARYQPNRGHLYSSSIFLPNKNAIGIRNFGIFNAFNGAYFSLEDGVLYAVIRTTVNSVTSEPFKEPIDLVYLNEQLTKAGLPEFDYEKGNIYDIQMQWRGVGNIKWFVGDPLKGVSVQVAVYDRLNTGTELSISNPSLPVGYECINTDGTEVSIEGGCVDISTEGGDKGKRSYAAYASGEIAITTAETPIVALRIPLTVGGVMNTRDIVLSAILGFSDVNATIRVYYFRDPTLITATWTNIRSGFQQAALNGAVTAFAPANMIKILDTRISANLPTNFTNPDKNNADFFLTHGDYLFITLQGKNNSIGGTTLEFAEEI